MAHLASIGWNIGLCVENNHNLSIEIDKFLPISYKNRCKLSLFHRKQMRTLLELATSFTGEVQEIAKFPNNRKQSIVGCERNKREKTVHKSERIAARLSLSTLCTSLYGTHPFFSGTTQFLHIFVIEQPQNSHKMRGGRREGGCERCVKKGLKCETVHRQYYIVYCFILAPDPTEINKNHVYIKL